MVVIKRAAVEMDISSASTRSVPLVRRKNELKGVSLLNIHMQLPSIG